MKTKHQLALAALALIALTPTAQAADRPDAHAPIGVMADHTHHKGEIMFSYRYAHMDMGGNLIGSDEIAPNTIVTTIPNRFASMPGQPPTLRIVPNNMSMDMHMVGVMYAPVDWVTLMAMGMYITKDMTLTTYQGGTGANQLGSFETEASGIGDISLMAIFPVIRRPGFEINLRAGLSAPTGSTTETAAILTPMNMRPTARLPYAMQLGSGTWDLLPGITVKGHEERIGWGAQYQGTLRTGANEESYRLGDTHMMTGWVSYEWAPWVSTSARIAGRTTAKIHGIDPVTVGPVQTANPDYYGGERLDTYIGANFIGTRGALESYRLGVEIGTPLYQDLNGPQMKARWGITLGLQKAF